jgi:hypothetical protein
MADNSTLPAAGDVIATDDIGGVKYQRTKSVWGADGTANDTDTASGKALPVQARGSDGTDRSLSGLAYSPTPLSFTCGTSAYAAGDVVGVGGGSAVLDLGVCGPSAGDILITSMSLEIDTGTIISGETTYSVHFYRASPASALADSAAFDLASADRVDYLGSVELGQILDKGSTLFAEVNNITKHIHLSGTHLFAYLVSNGAYTPTARVIVLTIHTVAF